FPDFLFFGVSEVSLPEFTFSSHLLLVGCIMLFVGIYTSLSGMWGISSTDTFKFVMAMAGCIVLAIFAVNHSDVGGIEGLREKLPSWVFNYTPEVGGDVQSGSGLLKMSITAVIAYLGVQWWASWYPGAEPGGGGYIAQRMMSAKNEKHSLLATLWFQVAHFAVRPWPWIIVALAALVMYPAEADKGATFVMVIRDIMPSGLLGLLIAAFLAAYMSTIASQTVWGTSYIINDLFKPFVIPYAHDKSYIRISRVTTFILLLLSLLVTSKLERISDAWKFILSCSGGIGIVLILRWFWWRINAWSEIAAMLAPYVVYPVLLYVFKLDANSDYGTILLIIVAWSSIVWLTVTFLTPASKNEILLSFYRKVHPGGIGWKRISRMTPDVKGDKGYGYLLLNWISGSIMVMLSLFGIGELIFGRYLSGTLFVTGAFACAVIIYFSMSRIGWKSVAK
ncbi:MAG: sodium:proline symporter, partial [Bacteroidetes bacterium]|nr:sodium:proline symporter [Bacteroidota bacterium]